MNPWVTIVIPTRQSARWIGVLLDHYAARGFVPTLLLDDRTRDDTRAIAAAKNAPIVDINGFSFTEAIVSVTARCVPTPWALFMHDDEIPSDRLFARLRAAPPPPAVHSVAIPRRWAWYEPGAPLTYGRSSHWGDRTGASGTDHNWRLFQPRAVRFISEMHTEGFQIETWSRVDLDTYFVHFEWVIRTHAQRTAKLRHYDRQRDGYGRFFENVYLPETQPEGVIEYRPFGTDTYDALARAYFSARGEDAPVPPLTLRDHFFRARSALSTRLGLASLKTEPKDRIGLAPKPEREIPDPVGW